MTRLTVDTPVGKVTLLESGGVLLVSCFENNAGPYAGMLGDASDVPAPVLLQAHRELREYFEGKRRSFSVALGVHSDRAPMGTPFERRAWQTLTKIGYGRTISYKEQALWMGHPNAIRAVGRANGKNPLAIFVPCHRVIATSGELTGFAGGIEAKAFLLNLEASCVDRQDFRAAEHHFAVLK